jgi:hypothetical protein
MYVPLYIKPKLLKLISRYFGNQLLLIRYIIPLANDK